MYGIERPFEKKGTSISQIKRTSNCKNKLLLSLRVIIIVVVIIVAVLIHGTSKKTASNKKFFKRYHKHTPHNVKTTQTSLQIPNSNINPTTTRARSSSDNKNFLINKEIFKHDKQIFKQNKQVITNPPPHNFIYNFT